MLLENKNTIIYGASGSIGGAREFAREGARVFLASRAPVKLDGVAERRRGGRRIGRGRGGLAPSARRRQTSRKLP